MSAEYILLKISITLTNNIVYYHYLAQGVIGCTYTLNSRVSYLSLQINDIAHALRKESFEAYRYYIHNLKNPMDDAQKGFPCPGCYDTNTLRIAGDGNLALVNLESGGRKYADSYHQEDVFFKDEEVQDYVIKFESTKQRKERLVSSFINMLII